jgi:hypothetical protein
VTLEVAIVVALAVAVWPVSILARHFPNHWRRTIYGSVGVYFLAFAFVAPEHRIVSLILACVGLAVAFNRTGKPA